MWYILRMERPWIIYSLSDPRTQVVRYVGITFRGELRRLTEHISRAVRGGCTHRDCWIRSLINEGLRPTLCLLQRGAGDGWQDAERAWIGSYPRATLTNHTDGGDGTPGLSPSPELRQKWSAMRRGVKYSPGRVSAMLGKTHSPAAVEKIRASSSGRRHTDDTRAKLSAAHRGKVISEAQRAKLSAAHTGKTLSEEHKSKITASSRGVRVLCVETGEVFASVSAAARFVAAPEQSISQATRKGCRCRGYHWERL